MTDTKNKPDGECFWHEKLGWFWKGLDRYESEGMAGIGYRIRPVCLVPPALLDWCEEVEKFFQDELKWGMIEDPESVKKLLDKLKEVRNEPTAKE